MNPPGWEQSKGSWLSGAIKVAYPFFMPNFLTTHIFLDSWLRQVSRKL